jgi:hypothetical protein
MVGLEKKEVIAWIVAVIRGATPKPSLLSHERAFSKKGDAP